jgi:hypothetical protein
MPPNVSISRIESMRQRTGSRNWSHGIWRWRNESMHLSEIKIGIQRALLRATLATPDKTDDAGWAKWVEWLSVYLYEFTKRAIQRGMTLEAAERHALKAMRRQLTDQTVAQLPTVPQKESSNDRPNRELTTAGRLDGQPTERTGPTSQDEPDRGGDPDLA